ncbi:hypothetical protein CEP52_007990 [Fusarium oligoseptatum]|uniref:Uncharacterized protein n=1 Tax=Fusarium oligoseptatum TaxID=2604345 RepID=A0A428TK32_9HYPO|nr:hypothetical protein CEP52_007990 [Fusarium oligoseptatum]
MLFKAFSLNLLLTLGSVAASSISERDTSSLETRLTCGKNAVKIGSKCYCKSIVFTMAPNGDCGCDAGYKVSGLFCVADCPSSAYVNWKNKCACRKSYLTFKENDCKCDQDSQKDDGTKCTDICPGPFNTWQGGNDCACEENYVPNTAQGATGCVRDCSNGAVPNGDSTGCVCTGEHFVLKGNQKECECDPDYVPGTGADEGTCVPKCFNGATSKADHTCECLAPHFKLKTGDRECECADDYIPGTGADEGTCVPLCSNRATPKQDHSGCECLDTNSHLVNDNRECACNTKFTLGSGPNVDICIPDCSNGATPKSDNSACECLDTNAQLTASDQECECKSLFKPGTGSDEGSCVPDCGTATPKADKSGCECNNPHFQLKTNQVDCECTAPFVPGKDANADKCVPVCVAPATLKADGSACECPSHAHLKTGDLECECDTKYKLTTKPTKQPTCIYDCGSAKLNPTFDGCICDKANTEFKDDTKSCGCKAGYTGLSRFGCVSDCGTTDAKWNSAKSACICNVKAYTYTPASGNVAAKCGCAKATDVYEEGDGICHESCGADADWNKKSRACICRKKGMQFNNGACACPKPDEQKWNGSKCVPDCGDDAQYDNKQARCVCLKRGMKWANKQCACDSGFTWKNQNKGCVANP